MQIGSVFEQAHRLVDERSIRYCAALGLSPSEDAWRALRVRVTLRLIARARAVAERRDSSIAMVLMREGGALLDRLAHESLEADVTNRMIGLVYLAVEDYGIRLFHGGDRITIQPSALVVLGWIGQRRSEILVFHW